MSDIRITNCPVHLFTVDHAPKGFAPFGLGDILRKPATWWGIRRGLHLASSIGGWEAGERFARFASYAKANSQRENFEVLRKYYTPGTRFVVLPMDMAYMGLGEPRISLEEQHNELKELADEFEGLILPFAAVDPRRPGVMDELERCREMGFVGVKLYPPLGYMPGNEILHEDVYPYCVEHNLPVMSHCSRGGVRKWGMFDSDQAALASPEAFKNVLKDHPKLKVCLAHFGGDTDWKNYLGPPRRDHTDPNKPFRKDNFLALILDMLRSGDYPNLWTDISYTLFQFTQNVPALDVFMNDEKVASRVLFGSDYYMTEQEEDSERRVSFEIRHGLGEDKFRRIAETNPEAYLFGDPVSPPGD